MIQPTASFKDNLSLLPSIDGLSRIDIFDAKGNITAAIENQPGKQGSLAVYQYLHQAFGALNVEAARKGVEIFAEHSEDAKDRPGAHPNIDRLFDVIAAGDVLTLRLVVNDGAGL